MTDKIILFLVEGPTDEDTLALIYSKLVKGHDIKFEVLHTDITADEEMTVKYIEKRIKEALEVDYIIFKIRTASSTIISFEGFQSCMTHHRAI